MLQAGIIRESSSPWAFPVVVVKKKNGKLRFCVDYRKLNEVTIKDSYPLPRVDELIDTIGAAKWFTTMDLASGYWQVEVKEKDRPKTAFVTRYGLYEFNVMPFGLTNAPATFQRVMDQVLKEVFHRIRRAGLRLNPSKCHFGRKSVTFLGHVISEGRVETDPSNTEKVARYPEPTNKTQLRGFLGLTGYYRRFIEGYATLAEPLNRLLRNKEPYEWRAGQEQAFDTLSRSLTQAERNYDTTEREALAVVWAIKKLRHYRSGATHLNADALSRIPPQLTPAQQLVSHNSESRI
jgi:hypothetical protein